MFSKFSLTGMVAGVVCVVFMGIGSIRAASVALRHNATVKLPRVMTPAQAARDPAVEAHVNSLLQKLTLAEKIRLLSGVAIRKLTPAEKIQLLSGVAFMSTRSIPRLGIPDLVLSDGRVGVHNCGASTLFPATVALVASWNKKLSLEEGIAMGRDARSRGINIVLSPLVNLYREPQDGRNFEK